MAQESGKSSIFRKFSLVYLIALSYTRFQIGLNHIRCIFFEGGLRMFDRSTWKNMLKRATGWSLFCSSLF